MIEVDDLDTRRGLKQLEYVSEALLQTFRKRPRYRCSLGWYLSLTSSNFLIPKLEEMASLSRIIPPAAPRHPLCSTWHCCLNPCFYSWIWGMQPNLHTACETTFRSYRMHIKPAKQSVCNQKIAASVALASPSGWIRPKCLGCVPV